MFNLSFPEPQPERMLTEIYIGTITEYEQTPAGLQFVMESYNLTMEGEPLKIKFVITENTIWNRGEIGDSAELAMQTGFPSDCNGNTAQNNCMVGYFRQYLVIKNVSRETFEKFIMRIE